MFITAGRAFIATAIFVWLGAAVLAFVYKDVLRSSELGDLIFLVLLAPFALVLRVLAEALGEGIVFFMLVVAFKVVTLGQIRTAYTAGALDFPWYGISRGSDGRLVASENAVGLIGIVTYLVLGLVWYFWWTK